ncbi:MAG: nucleotidyltransferase domain-containing protein [Candidatus Nanohalobium sp.]
MRREEVLENVRSAVREVCQEYDVVAAYLFGSFVRGEEKEDSDIDVAVFFRDYNINKLLELGRKIQEEAGVEREIDVRALNRSGTAFSFRVISEGEVLYESEASERADVEQMIDRRYHDMKPYFEDYRREMKQRLASYG